MSRIEQPANPRPRPNAFSTRTGILGLDTQGRIRFNNPAANAILGRLPGEMIDVRFHSLICGDQAGGAAPSSKTSPIDQILTDGSSRCVSDKTFFRKGDSGIAIEYLCAPMLDESGRVTGAVVSFQEINVEQSQETEHADSIYQFEETLDAVSDLFAVFDREWNYVYLNRKAAAFTGHNPKDLIGKNIWTQFPQVVGKTFHRELLAAAQSAKANHFELFYPATGRLFEHRVYPHRHGLSLLSTDVTEQKLAYVAAARDALQLQNVKDAVIVTDLNGIVTYWNKGATALFGWTAEERVGQPLANRFPESVRPMIDQKLSEIIAGQEWTGEFEDYHKDGSRVWIDTGVSLLTGPEATSVGIIGVSRDIRDRKEVQGKLLRLNRMHALLSQINTTIVRVRSRQALFDAACQIAVETAGFRAAWIGLINQDTPDIRAVASAGAIDGYFDEIKISTGLAREGQGPFGTAIRENRNIVCNDIAHDENFAPWREPALLRGYRSAAVFPLRIEERVIGGFAFYAPVENYFDPPETKLLNELAANLSFAIWSIDREEKRQQAETALRESEERFRKVFDHAAVGISIVSRDNRFLRVNVRFCEIVDYSAEELLTNLSCLDITHPDDRQADLAAVARLLAGEESVPLEMRYLRKDGRVVWGRFSISMLHSQTGEPEQIIRVMEDITERKRAEDESRRRSEQIMQLAKTQISILNALPANIALVDLNGVIITVNEAWRRFASANVLQGSHFAVGQDYLAICERAHGECAEEALAAAAGLRRVLRGEITQFSLVYPCHSPTEKRWFRLMATPLSENRRAGAVVMHLDTTERHLAAEAVAESEQQQRQLARQLETERRRLLEAQAVAKVGSWETDLDTLDVTWSEETYRIFETSPDRFAPTHHKFLTFVHPEDRAAVDDILIRSIGQSGPFSIEHRIVMPDGRVKFVEERWRTFKSEQGRPLRAIGTCQDMTERRNVQLQLLQSQKMEAVGLLAGGIAHDFNNLLTIILGYTETLMSRIPATDAAAEMLSAIQDAAESAARLTRQLLTFSRKEMSAPKTVNLNDAINDIEKMLRRVIREDIEFIIVLQPNLRQIQIDPGHLEQVVMNLTVNARDAMPDGGRLMIETADVEITESDAMKRPTGVPGRYVALTVSDTGCGMTPEVKAHIFEPFFTTKGPGRGTGLGLPTVFGIVQQSQGLIEVDSVADIGTSFTILFPARDERLQHAFPPEETAPSGCETILLVEDEEPVRRLLKIALESSGYTVLCAADGLDAIRVMQTFANSIDLVITDIVMPNLNGRELVAQIRRDRPEIRVLFMSGYTDDILMRRGISGATDAFIHKPFPPKVLLQKVRNILDNIIE